MSGHHRLSGRLIMVQESRFRLAAATGRSCLFTLSHSSSVDEMDLLDFFKADTPVTIEYEGEPDLASGMVTTIKPLKGSR